MKMPRSIHRLRSRAFTLVEVLIATVIFAAIMAALNAVFYGALRLRTKTSQSVERMTWSTTAASVLRRDLRAVMAPGGALAGPIRFATAGNQEEARLELHCASGLAEPFQPWPDVQRVEYYLAPSQQLTNAFGKDLVRAVTRNLLAQTESLPTEQVLISGVSRMDLWFYDGAEWHDTWDSTTQDPAAPTAIKCRVEFEQEIAGKTNMPPIQLVVPVVMLSRTNATASAQTNSPSGAPSGGGGGGGGPTGGQPSNSNTPGGGAAGGGGAGGGNSGGRR